MVFDSLNSAKQSDFGSSIRSEVGAVSSFDKSDFYRFEVKANSGAFLSLSGLSADASLTLMDATGKSLSVSNRSGMAAEAINMNLAAGTYYIGVGQVSGNTTYKLNLSSNGAFANINENINWFSGDWNGDDFEDVLRQEQGASVDGINDVQFFLGAADGSFQAAVNVANMALMHGNVVNLIVGDINGDGTTELVRQEKGVKADGIDDVQILDFQNGNFQVVANLPNMRDLNGNLVNLVGFDGNADGRMDLIRQEKGVWVDGMYDVEIMTSKGSWEFASPTLVSNMGALTGNNVTLVASGTELMRLETGAWVNGQDDVQFTRLENNNFANFVNAPTDAFTRSVEVKPWEDAIAQAYSANQTALGQLVSNQATSISPLGTTGRLSKYSSGSTIHWSAKTGAVIVTAEMEKIYGQVGGSGTWLGMPTGNQYAWQGGTRQNFEGGYLFQNQSVASAFRPNELPVANNDFTGDGKADILWRNTSTGENLFWKMDGMNLDGLASTIAVTDKGFKIVGTGDFDRDGQNDILWHHSKTGEVVIARMNGTNLVEYRTIDKIPDMNWQVAGVADLDKDGRADIVWRNKATGENLVWKMDNMARQSMLKLDTVADTRCSSF
jgi:Bacterial pre-peptidase C-terminal domain/FG-GAP-like repeat